LFQFYQLRFFKKHNGRALLRKLTPLTDEEMVIVLLVAWVHDGYENETGFHFGVVKVSVIDY
jgi:hypothetical protein